MAKNKSFNKINDKKVDLKVNDQKAEIDINTVHFSFRFLEIKHDKFSFSSKDVQYFEKVLERLQKVSTYSVKRLINDHTKALRVHPINWDRSSEPKGFSNLNEQIRDQEAYQISMSSNAHGRIHGFFIQNIFFVIWFDPHHLLFPENK